eukprot:Plantae.Rhodophyta-Rhodochaete_pulchella.ctg27361.p1 GENE.Plantae.Rhodophyta-Rhodochaete_pulchella.ctg27361~~Plantae.Rhodophyta-Rhodochaete_pulchella.ctg27361.p1  ORF type:complete len:136 (-),score=20.75 Plantae.Rhodophyta-Rhodochaete_pulchella.ctg27361:148-528(-)
MVLFDIPDIRYFWSTDPRFLEQFADGEVRRFVPFSKYPPCYKDLSFWVDGSAEFDENGFFEITRSVAGDVVECVERIDQFKRGPRVSLCYRLTYRSMERSLTNDQVDALQAEVRARVAQSLPVELR